MNAPMVHHRCLQPHNIILMQLPTQVLTKVSDLRTEAGKQFLAKEFSKAADNYDAAFKLLPDGSAEKPELLQKKVGCLINLKK